MTYALPFITLVALAWPLVRTLGRGDLAHMLVRSRRIRVLVTGALAIYLAACLVAFLGPPAVQWVLAAAALICLVFFVVYTHPSYGRRRGLPPGSLTLLGQMDQVDDRFLLKKSERHGPVFKTTLAWVPTVCVVGIDQIVKLVAQHDRRLSRGEMLYSTLIPHRFLRYMECNSWRDRYRPLLAQALVLSGDDRFRTIVSSAVYLELEHIEALSSARNSSGIRPHQLVPAAMLRIFITVIFGAKQNTPEMARLEALYGILNCRKLANGDLPAAGQALSELNDRVRALVDPREGSGDSCGFRTLVEKDPALLADDTVVGNMVAMVQVGSYDHASLLVWIWKYLSDFPEWRDRLRREVESGGNPVKGGLADRIISETLRLEQSEYLKRTALETLEFDGFRIPKGWSVQMCLRESHQDPTHFSAPQRFNPDRFIDDPIPSQGYAPFGIGPGRCPAQQLTYRLAACFLHELVSRYSWRVVADGPRHHDGIHWTPSLDFRIDLSRIEEQAYASTLSEPDRPKG